jgi:hypothetical protein
MKRATLSLFALLSALALLAPAARADHRYFLQGYPPFVSPKGESEISVWTNAFIGQNDSTGAAWEHRAEYEYAISNRLTGSLYLNWTQANGADAAQHFAGPSLALVYAFAEPGKLALNPAAYLEVQEDGDVLSIYPSLLLGQKFGAWMTGANVAGEIEMRHRSVPGESDTEKKLSLTGGLSRDLGHEFALGIEARYAQVFPGGSEHPAALFAGPTLDLDADKVQLVLGWHPQLTGSPVTRRSLNLSEFAKSEFRMILSIEL